MAKYAILMLSADDYPEGRGRMAHAMVTAEGLLSKGHDVKILFQGQGVQWLRTWQQMEHPFAKNYRERFERIRPHIAGACAFCTDGRFKVGEEVRALDVSIRGADGGHDDMGDLIEEGYQLVTF